MHFIIFNFLLTHSFFFKYLYLNLYIQDLTLLNLFHRTHHIDIYNYFTLHSFLYIISIIFHSKKKSCYKILFLKFKKINNKIKLKVKRNLIESNLNSIKVN